MIVPTTQPRTVLNLVHSARKSWEKPSRPAGGPERYGVVGAAHRCRLVDVGGAELDGARR